MRKFITIILLITISIALFGQDPLWIDANYRNQNYPAHTYFTGFAALPGDMLPNTPIEDIIQQIKAKAQTDLSEQIRLKISSVWQNETELINTNGRIYGREHSSSFSITETDAEVTGIKTETYQDPKTKHIYAFAYLNRHELTGYHKSNLTFHISQIESLLQTAQSLETHNEKGKARKQGEAARLLFVKVRNSQEMLIAIDVNISTNDLQQTKTETLYEQLTQMQARLAQAIYVYVETEERNFSKPTTILGNQLKSALAKMGCSFVDDATDADFHIEIEAATRHYTTDYGFVTCYADVQITLTDNHKKKTVFQDEFSQKGVANTQENAGRKALEDAAPNVTNRISPWIEK